MLLLERGELRLNIGKTIHNRRKELGLSMEKLAFRMGRKDSYISNLENGKAKSIGLDDLPKHAKALDWNLLELIIAAEGVSDSDLRNMGLGLFDKTEMLTDMDVVYVQRLIDACTDKKEPDGVNV